MSNENLTLIACPLCGYKLYETENEFICSNTKESEKLTRNCSFIFQKRHKSINAVFLQKQLIRLLDGEHLRTPNQKCIALDLSSPCYFKILGEDAPKTVSSEPQIKETAKTYRLGNKFCYKMCFGDELSLSEAKLLLEGEEVELTRTSKKNDKPYSVAVWLGDDGQIEHRFIS